MTTNSIETALTPITQAQRMLAEAKTLPDLREIHDFAIGARAWAKARGIGIEAENDATEVILRAERRLGDILLSVPRSKTGPKSSPSEGSRTPFEETVAEAGLEKNPKAVHHFQRLAEIDEARFEAMLRAARAVVGGRLSRIDLVRAIDKAQGKRAGAEEARPTPINPDFEAFRRGAYGLLGWEFDDSGVGKATKNGMLTLPNDELAQTATLIKALAVAFNEARVARA
jgi:hypothetical protein